MRNFSILALICSIWFPLSAFEEGDWLIRGRAIYISPNEDTGSVTGAVVGSKVSVRGALMPELDFTYMATDHIGLELILATAEHNLQGNGALSGTKVGSIWLLPPTLLAQYHFYPTKKFQPYVGAGINYTVIYAEDTPIAGTKLRLDNSVGFAAQVGMDYMINDDWFVNVDFKYICIDTKAKLTGAVAGTAKVDIDPFIFGLGVGRRF